jgi:transporter family protein
METWVRYAIFSMLFAGFTSVIAKRGLEGISGEVGLTVRTCFVFVLVIAYAAAFVPGTQWANLRQTNFV